jgi:cold shock CspA family protein
MVGDNMKGKVKWYNIVEGCGSFQCENGDDIIFHRNVLPIGTFLNKGDEFEFEVVGSENGQIATNVRKLD